MIEIALGALLFTAIVMGLVVVVLVARRYLVVRGDVEVLVNGRRALRVPIGERLLPALIESGHMVPSACGGAGTCGLCRVQVVSGVRPPLPIEAARIGRRELQAGTRLACQLTLREDLEVKVAGDRAGIDRFECIVRSNRNVATFIKEVVLALPEGKRLDFRAGAFVQITCPAYHLGFESLRIDPPFDAEWERLGLRRLQAGTKRPTVRAYSLANHPGEEGVVMLNVRIATPPPDAGPEVPPGVVSSWIFALAPGDHVAVAGPFGHFFAQETDREMVFVGGGAGMAPMRAHILDQLERLKSERKISFWYGARSRRELFYVDEFDRLQAEHPNFRWCAALSEPRPGEEWDGAVGFVHQVLHERYLARHPAPEACEYYLCGPPMMIQETRRMLGELGVDPDDVHFDDFGG